MRKTEAVVIGVDKDGNRQEAKGTNGRTVVFPFFGVLGVMAVPVVSP
jgi:hypothetical protein